MDATFLEWLIGQAGIGGLAAMALYLLNRSYQDNIRREKENAEIHRADKQEMMRVITETSRAISILEKTIDALNDRASSNRKPPASTGRGVP